MLSTIALPTIAAPKQRRGTGLELAALLQHWLH